VGFTCWVGRMRSQSVSGCGKDPRPRWSPPCTRASAYCSTCSSFARDRTSPATSISSPCATGSGSCIARRSRPETAPATALIPEWVAATRLRRAAPPHLSGHRPVRTQGHESRRKPTTRPASVGCCCSAGHPAAPSMSSTTMCRTVCPGTCHSALRIVFTPRLSYAELRGPQISIREQHCAAPSLTADRGHLGDRVDDLQIAWLMLGWLLAFWAGKDLQTRFVRRQDSR